MKKHILDFKENECIHVPTKEEAEWLMNEFDKLSVGWRDIPASQDAKWDIFEEETVYYPYKTLLVDCNERAREHNETIYTLDQLDLPNRPTQLIRPLEALVEFQTAFKCPVNETPTLLDKDRAKLRYDLGKEELDEYLEAVEAGDIVGIADSVGDQLFVLMGTALEHGLQHILMDIFEEIFRSNMSKLDENRQPIINGENGVYDESKPMKKVLKSKNYFPPNLKQFLINENI